MILPIKSNLSRIKTILHTVLSFKLAATRLSQLPIPSSIMSALESNY